MRNLSGKNWIRYRVITRIKVIGILVLSSQQPKSQFLQTGLKRGKLMKGPTSHKGSTTIKIVEEMQGDGKEHKIYSPFSEKESIHLPVEYDKH